MSAQPEVTTAVDEWASAIATYGMCSTSLVPQKWQPLAGFSNDRYRQYAEWVCDGCPVLAECAAYGQQTGAVGIYGGQYRPPHPLSAPRAPKAPKAPKAAKAAKAPKQQTMVFGYVRKTSPVRITRAPAEDQAPNWRDRAACGQRGDLPWTDEKITASDARAMRDVCRGCPVFEACAALRDEAKPCAGFWAGTNCNTTQLGPDAESSPWASNPPAGPPDWARPVAEQLQLDIATGINGGNAGSVGVA